MHPKPPTRPGASRPAAFAVLCVICVSAMVVTVVHAVGRDGGGAAAPSVEQLAAASEIMGGPHVVFRDMAPASAGYVGVAELSPGGARSVADLQCLRVHMGGGQGLCLNDRGGFLSQYQAVFFGPDFQVRHTRPLAGLVSRARVSPDGRYGAATVFVTGHSYAEGSFSTMTSVYDMATGKELAELEEFDVYHDGSKIRSVDFNFWGVTFAPEAGRFYATLGTGGHTYLVRGDLATKRVDVLRHGVECPSLSPDGTRIAFKRKVTTGDGPTQWRPAVLDLATLEDHPLAESNPVDDQIEWLDDDTVIYAVDTGVGAPSTWATPADGQGEPRLFIENGDSPAVVRS